MDFKVGYMNGADNLYPKGAQPMFIELTTNRSSGNYPLTDLYGHLRLQFISNATYFKDNFAGSTNSRSVGNSS